ncbi:hypothetical protein BSKO_00592 [Bryopsis sp. KO-2023]|nr:hypothetical protein BSKO_00592 [Bryopsis sp. KO-2023]
MVSELGKTKFSTWTREVAEWAIPYAGCGGISFEEKSYALLRLAVPGSPACRLFANRIEKVQTQGLELNFINGKYAGEDATEFTVFASPLSAVGAAEAWIILVAELRAALPTDLASDEQKLRREKMRPKEKLEHFTTRFCQAADQMDKLAETVKCSILYSHLPKSAQELVRSLPKSSTTLKAMLERLHESLAWDSGGGAVGSAADPMEIDTVNVQSVIQGERVEFSAIKTMQDFRMASRHLARRNQGYRNFLQDVLRDGARGTQRQGRFQNRPWQRPKNYRQGQTEREKIFNIDVPVFEDALFGGDVDTNQGDTEEQSQGVNTVKMTSSGSLLFCPAVINAQVTCNGLIDTGAGVSLISAKIAKLAGAVPQPTERVLRCANQSALTCLGTAQVTLTIGQTSLQQWVFVCPELGYDMILGNDVLCELKAKPNPAHRVLELPRQPAVQCLAVAPESVGDQGFVWRLTAAEPLPVQPVVKDGVLFCALGSSRVIAAQSTLTVVLPIVPSTSVAFFDSGRLPAGVSASSAIWMRGHSLRVTLTNATATPVMLGSRTAIAGVLLAATTVELKQADGIVRTLATYSPPTTPATMVANVRPCAADLPSQFPALFASTVGSFKPEVIEELPFVSTPSTLAPPQPPLVGQEFLAAQQQITTWTKQGVLRPVSWTPRVMAPFFMVPKPHSSALRMVVDFRLLNASVRQVFSPGLHRHALVRTLGQKKIFSTLDVSSAFTCIRLHPSLHKFFGICFDHQFFVFTRLPFGFHNSMHWFLRAIQYSLSRVRSRLRKEVPDAELSGYVDDLCLGSDSIESHRRALLILCEELQRDGWVLNFAKCSFFQNEVCFVGVRFSAQGVCLDPSVITKVAQFQRPVSRLQLRSFFGLCLGLIPFNPNVSAVLARLRAYCQAPPDRFSTPEFCRDWDTVVTRLTSALWRLHYWQPHSDEPLRLYVDSSSLAHGALLVQGQRLVAMWSAYNTQPFRSSNFSELRGFCRAVTALRAFLINQKFDIYTDNRTVVAMFSATSSTDFIRRQLAQVQDLFVYPLRVHHIAGQENFLADLLSRQRYLVERSEVCPVEAGNQELCLKKELEKEEQWKGFLQAAQLCYKHQLVWKNGMLQKWMDSDYKVVIPRSMVKTVLETCHDKAGHFGVEKTLERMRRSFFWTDMRKDAEAHCRTCDTCQRFGKLRKTASSLSIPTDRPMQVVAVDFVGPLDISGVHKYILVGVDFFSRWVEAKPVSSATSDQLVHFVEAWRHKWGRIESLMGDNGGAFGSSYFAKYLAEKKIEKVEISSYSPKSNGRVERANQTLVHRLQRMCWKDKSRWSEFVTEAVELMRDSRSSVLGFSPREILLGQNAQGKKVDILEIRRKVRDLEKQIGEKQVAELDPQKFLEKEIVIGGLVLVRNNFGDGVHGQKFEPKWKGPYRVQKKKGNRLFELETIEGVKIKGVFHHDRLRRYFKR